MSDSIVPERKAFKRKRRRVLSGIVTAVTLLVLLASGVQAGGPDYSVDEIYQFTTYYYLHPEPNSLGAMLCAYLNLESFTNVSPDRQDEYVISYFFGRAGRSKPAVVNEYIKLFEEGNHQQRVLILKVLRFCGNEETRHFFETSLREGRFGKEQSYIVEAIKEGMPLKYDPVSEPIDSLQDLDFLWTEFEATGNEKIVKRIITVLHQAQDSKGLDAVVGNVGKSSLAYNCRKHERVVEICREEMSASKGATKQILQEVIKGFDNTVSVKKAIRSGHHREVPSNIKAWTLGCSAVLWERNHDRHDSLAGMDINDRNIRARKKLLSKSWGIVSRADLFDTLRWIEEGGHRRSFEDWSRYIVNMSDWRYTLVLLGNLMRPEQLRKIVVVKKYCKEVGQKGILGWDYSRYIALCRWGYGAGYISEDEAWQMIFPVAWRLQEELDSWEALGRNYLVGREFWGGGVESTYKFEDAYHRLIDMPSSPCNKYPWDMDLRYFADNQDKQVRRDDE